MLPGTLSELLRLALADLRKAEADPRYVVDMGTWHHEQRGAKPCFVCLAGSVMAFSLGVPIDEFSTPKNIGGTIEQKLMALNSLREGDVEMALKELGLHNDRRLPTKVFVPHYPHAVHRWEDREERIEAFHQALEALADRMASVGL